MSLNQPQHGTQSQRLSPPYWTHTAMILTLLLMPAAALAQTDAPLVEAARNRDLSAIRMMVGSGSDPNQRSGDGSTALLWASYHDDIDTAERLLGAGADPDLANDLGATPLWAASQNGSTTMTALLIDAGANPNATLLSGESPLMVAARSGYPIVVEQLLDGGADVNIRATRGQTPLMWAVAERHPGVVEILLEAGADVHARSESWDLVMAVPPHGYRPYNKAIPHGANTALMFAAQVGDLASARLLVDAGADVNDTDAWGVSATTMAGHSGFADMVRFFLANGADPNEAGPGFTALHTAIMRRDEVLVRDLLNSGADPNLPVGTWTPMRRTSSDFHFGPELVGATPYWIAARFTEPRIMALLAEHGADPRFVHRGAYVMASITGEGLDERANVTSALMAALGMGRGNAWIPLDRSQRETRTMETARLAIELGVDLNVRDTNGQTALDRATQLENDSLVELLVARGAEPGDTDVDPTPTRPGR